MKKIFLTICLFVLIISCKKKEVVRSIETSQVSDIEGNIYKTVKIGDQWWMAENLRTKRYNDSSLINEYVLGQNNITLQLYFEPLRPKLIQAPIVKMASEKKR